MAKNRTETLPTYGSIFRTVEETARSKTFPQGFFATQITLTGDGGFQPMYIRVEDGSVETAPYEYHGADFYIDCDTGVMADILNGKCTIYDAVSDGKAAVNGDAAKALVFIHAFFG